MEEKNKNIKHRIPAIANDIRNIEIFCKNKSPKIVVRCLTFNHEKYIREALEGFIIQKTQFPFIVIVHDDASTDNTADIIREYAQKYPDIIFPILEKENQYSKNPGNIGKLLNEIVSSTGAEYVALCEGDDYWIDPLKIQKQVTILDQNPDIGLCYTGFDIKFEKSKKFIHDPFNTQPEIYSSNYKDVKNFILKRGYVAPPSWMARTKLWKDNLPSSLDGTFVRFADFLHSSKVFYLPDVTAVYRILQESASHSSDYERIYLRTKNLLDTGLKMIEFFDLGNDFKNEYIIDFYRYYLKSFVVNLKYKDVRDAKEIITNKTPKENFLFFLSQSKLNIFLFLVKRIKNLFI